MLSAATCSAANGQSQPSCRASPKAIASTPMTPSPSYPPFIGERGEAWHIGAFTYGNWSADRWGDEVVPHEHEHGHFMLVLGGRYSSSLIDGEPDGLPIMIYNPPGTCHRDRFEEPGRFFSIEVNDAGFFDEAEFCPPRRSVRLAPGQALETMRRIRHGVGTDRDGRQRVEALTLDLIGALAPRRRMEARPPRWLGAIVEIVREMPETPSAATLAAMAKVHPVHLTRTFRRFLGYAPVEYAMRARLARAATLLGRTRRPIAEIALDAGFVDQSHFTNRFRSIYGVPPGRFRRCMN